MKAYKTKALNLLTASRFDVMAKYIYAKHRGVDSSFPLDLYRHHLEVWNNCNEITNPDKSSLEDFIRDFDLILRSIKEEGFDENISCVPTFRDLALNGAHRIAAAILHDKEVVCRESPQTEGQLDCGYYYLSQKEDFIQGGLARLYADNMALEYAKLKKNTFVITLFPSAQGGIDEARALIARSTDIVYEKSFNLNAQGAFNFIKTLYAGEAWLGNFSTGFQGVKAKRDACYTEQGATVAFLVETNDPQFVLGPLKKEIRELFKIGNHSTHINDTHEETISIAQSIFNDNSIHFMNSARISNFPFFSELLAIFKNTLIAHHLNFDNFCITASSVLSAYGLREGKDLDYLHAHPTHKFEGHSAISSHNTELGMYQHNKDDILYNPANYFYVEGLKFASLGVVRALKEKRNEEKDRRDCELITEIS